MATILSAVLLRILPALTGSSCASVVLAATDFQKQTTAQARRTVMLKTGGSSENIANMLTAHEREPTDFPDDSPLGKGDLREPREPVPEFDEDEDDLDETEEIELDSILDADDPDDDLPPPE
ncbi:hypothetical protein [Ensifer adhaerens]|uniref:hypothetical protein n=2 Tax=Ensifer TaxID=106591 RepID=UPI001C4DE6AC|nr:hypothetical protein [Ensifer adhaerens]MBW0370330.1 hypothetical protein [Ensifer adhaerens]UCM24106.1 hypothetical protein LDL63_30595 [Ensifer adhaerens]